ncbi:MAG: hypothetical protein ACR2OI_06585 [Acidimicrobiia bacterium]
MGNRGRIPERLIHMKHRLLTLALLTVALGACGAASEGSNATSIPGPASTPAEIGPIASEPATPIADRQDSAADRSRSAAEPALLPVPVPVPDPPPKPVRGFPTPPAPRDLPTQPSPPAPSDPLSRSFIDEAVADLSHRFGIDPSVIEVLDARPVTWRDGSVGCPEVGLAYSQALVPGSLVVLRIGNASYSYHAADGASLFYCPTPQAPIEGAA